MSFTVLVFIYAILPTLVYLGIGLYILSLEQKKGPGYKSLAVIYFISVPSLILIGATITFSMNYMTGKYEAGTRAPGYELYKFLVLKDIIPRSGLTLDDKSNQQDLTITQSGNIQTTQTIKFNEDFLKDKEKLNFKEYGPFFGIKENGLMVRGIYKVPKNETAQTDFYGLFTKNEMFWKGYSKHTYNDGKIVYQYNEYQLDSDGKVIVKDGIYQLEDTYTITADDFEKVKKYIRYDISIPFSFYDFGETETEIVNKKDLKKENSLIQNNDGIKLVTNEKYYALVIGNNNYEHLEKLDAAENDAVVIADVLEKKYGFEVDLLLNADYDQTVNSLFKITDKLKRNDNLLIYYAGHGELDKDENRGYWLPVDASYEMRSKWISNQRIVDRIKATKAKHVLLVADSCFSGTLMRSGDNLEKEQSIDEKYIKRLKNKKTRLVITSGGNEPVVDSVGGDHSLFALKFIDTLKNNDTVINSQILFENVRRYVVANADQTPERAMVHKTGHDGGDFLFFPK